MHVLINALISLYKYVYLFICVRRFISECTYGCVLVGTSTDCCNLFHSFIFKYRFHGLLNVQMCTNEWIEVQLTIHTHTRTHSFDSPSLTLPICYITHTPLYKCTIEGPGMRSLVNTNFYTTYWCRSLYNLYRVFWKLSKSYVRCIFIKLQLRYDHLDCYM